MKRLAATAKALSVQMYNASSSGNNLFNNSAALKSLGNIRRSLDEYATGTGQFFARQMQVNSATETFTKRIAEQKVTFAEALKQRKMFNQVLREQISLQQASAIQWTRSSNGKLNATLYQPEQLSRGLKTVRAELGLFNAIVASGSDQLIKWGKNTQWAGRQLMVGLTVPVAIAAAATGKFAYDLDKNLTQVTKVYGDVTKGIQESSDSIRAQATATTLAVGRMYGQTAENTLGIMAQLAASGKTGNELQQATVATSRAALLGELEWQDAVKATISLQEVYHHNAQQVGDDFNYINAMENQTVLTSQDFVEAIPKVSGVMNALGADLKQTGTLLTAFKAAGIDAAEGANALKSINFRLVATYGKGLETFRNYTGRDLKALVNETNGETIPTLEKFADAIKNLSAPERIAVTRDVFGIYQGSKALLLLQQMVEKTDQWNQAIDVANNSVAQNAAIAQRELDRLNAQPFMKIKKAVAELQNQLALAGQQFLTFIAPLIEFVSKAVAWFNELGDGAKRAIVFGAAIAAVIGPLVMLAGLMGNLIGNSLKFMSSIAGLALRFKVTNAEERTQILLAKQAARGWDAQTASVSALTLALQKLADRYQNLGFAQKQARDRARDNANPRMGTLGYAEQNPPPGFSTGQRKNGTTFYREGNKFTSQARFAQAEWDRMRDEANSMNQQFNLDRATASIRRFTQAAGAGALGLGTLLMMFGDSENAIVSWSTKALFAAGIIGTTFPGAITKLVLMIKTALLPAFNAVKFNLAAAFALGPLRGLGAKMAQFLPLLKGLGIGFGALAVAGVIAWQQISDSMEANRKKMEDYDNTAKSLAETLGYSYQEASKFDPGTPSPADAVREMSAKWQKSDEGKNFMEVFGKNLTSSGDPQKYAKDTAIIWDEAIAQAMKARMHGASEDQAKATAQVILAAYNRAFTGSQFDVKWNDMFNVDDANAAMTALAGGMKNTFQRAFSDQGEGAEKFWRDNFWGQGNGLSAAGSQAVKDMAKENWAIVAGADPSEREKIIDQQFTTINKELMDKYKWLIENQGQFLKDNNINSFSDFIGDEWSGSMFDAMGLTPEKFQELSRQKDGVKQYLDTWAEASGVAKQNTNDWRTYIPVLKQIQGFIEPAKTDVEVINAREAAMDSYIQKIRQLGPAYDKMDAQEKLNLLNQYRMKGGLKETGNVLDWFATEPTAKAIHSVNDLTSALTDAGYNAAITADVVEESWRNVLTNTVDMAQEGRQNQVEKIWDAHIDRIQKEGEDKMDAANEAADKAKEKFDNKWDKRIDRNKKADEKAVKDMEKVYDKRIEAIEKQVDAEQKAEEQRQKIFEAEKTRLQRLAELYNDNIDINTAINTGKLDEAAKLQNDVTAKQSQWMIDDQATNSGDASKQKIDALEKTKDNLQKAKTARLDALKETQDAQQKALEDQRKAEEKALDKSLERTKKKKQAEVDAANATAKAWVDTKKKSLEQELALIRAYTPRNEGEMRDQITAIDNLYKDYGVKLKYRGEGWAKSVSSMLTYQTKIEAGKLKTVVNWASVGSEIASAMLQGAFGMTPKQFGLWLNGGQPPSSSVMAGENYNKKKYDQMIDRLEANAPGAKYHTGGIAGAAGGRATGSARSNEMDARLLLGEGIVNLRGMRNLGPEGLAAINSGQADYLGKGGGGVMGMGGLMAATIAASSINILRATLKGAAAHRMGVQPDNTFGTKIGAGQTPGDIASDAVGTAVGSLLGMIAAPTGKVLYLGHNGYYDGNANLGITSRPTSGVVTSEFGPRNLLGMTFHNGIDIANRMGTPTRAAAAGKVIYSGWDNTGYGNYIEIAHPDGTITGYGHHMRLLAKAGDRVSAGSQIGLMGSTGKSTASHLHFQTGRDGNWFNPRKLFPSLNVGGVTLGDGYAMLHKDEAVTTRPLTRDIIEGGKKFAEGPRNEYNINVTVQGDGDERKIRAAVLQTMKDVEQAKGPNRRVGGNR